jgi:hypothetical protein
MKDQSKHEERTVLQKTLRYILFKLLKLKDKKKFIHSDIKEFEEERYRPIATNLQRKL